MSCIDCDTEVPVDPHRYLEPVQRAVQVEDPTQAARHGQPERLCPTMELPHHLASVVGRVPGCVWLRVRGAYVSRYVCRVSCSFVAVAESPTVDLAGAFLFLL